MFRRYKNGILINSEYTHLANSFVSDGFGNRANTFYRLPRAAKSRIAVS